METFSGAVDNFTTADDKLKKFHVPMMTKVSSFLEPRQTKDKTMCKHTL